MLSRLEGQSVWAIDLKEVAQRAGIEPKDKEKGGFSISALVYQKGTSTCYSNRTKDLSDTQIAEGQ